MLHHAEHNCKQDKKQRNTSCRTVYCRIFGKRLHAVCHYICVKCICHHVGERRDNNQAEKPAKSEKQLSARLSDIFLDQKPHGLSVIFHTGIQRSKVCHRPEKYPSEDDPQKDREPAECSRLDCAGDWSCARDG